MGKKNLTRDYWQRVINAKTQAFELTAKKLGPKHPMTELMGSLAWGRHHHEAGPQPKIADLIYASGALEGYHDCLIIWSRDHDGGAQNVFLDIWNEQLKEAARSHANG